MSTMRKEGGGGASEKRFAGEGCDNVREGCRR